MLVNCLLDATVQKLLIIVFVAKISSLVVVPLVLDLPAQLLDEVLVVGDDDQLEVAVVGALLDQLGQGEGQRLDVVAVLGTVKGYFITIEKIALINGAKIDAK